MAAPSAVASAVASAAPSATPSATPSAEATGYPVAPVSPPEPAQVVWERAVVRDAPRTGVIVGRVPNASSVMVIARSGRWWQVRSGALTGWVFGESIGR